LKLAAPYLTSEREENRVDMDSDHRKLNIQPPGVIFAGLRIVKNFIQRLVRLVIPTEEELIEAGVYLGNSHS